MKKPFFLTSTMAIVAFGVVAFPTARPAGSSPADTIERGRYLVQQVGLCGDCHTPHNEKGDPIADQALQGANVFLKPMNPVPNWAEYTPAIAGFPGFTDEQAVTFLTTGKDAGGQFAAPPMPQYRFSREDAVAVLSYLKSLKK